MFKPSKKKERCCSMANSLAHSKWVCKYHIVFTPKYRRKIIYNQLRADIRDIIKDLCKWKGVEIIEGHMMPDHIHLLVSVPPKYSILEREKRNDDLRTTCKFEVQVWKPKLLGNRILRKHSGPQHCNRAEIYSRTRETGSDRR